VATGGIEATGPIRYAMASADDHPSPAALVFATITIITDAVIDMEFFVVRPAD
jgi:hypothetical protein